ncbi:MAG: Glu-tRNA(Gln) amidotransferase subunit GatE [Candidatus Methanoplasma sp.]|jgi:glutamyl-tRNA(Gln) amidotransferase subunit E|nr:Glu-tRNA(Gln) amidotransferase subunit GatE [Candidatus Methanoplasma sp.]
MSEERQLVCGIEIHQQLDAGKLFCECESSLRDEGYGSYYRRLRPTTSEMGEVDRAALAQFRRDMGFRYQCGEGCTCLVELDEEPPHSVNRDAMNATLTFSAMLNARVIDEVQFMRKIVVDGSNTSGYQRTALAAVGGSVEVNGKSIGILSVCLEEDAARKIETTGNETTYRLDRLGIPLIEVATAPDMETPEEVMEVAYRLGTLLRATKMVKRGIGTIREDLNISIPGGARVEIKGVQELRMLPDFVRNEMERQRMLLRIKDILVGRNTTPIEFSPADATEMFSKCPSKVIKGALDDKGKVIAVRLPGFSGVMNGDGGKLRLGAEMAQYARTKGVKGIFHSDELPNYGIEQGYVDSLRSYLHLSRDDAFVICAAKENKAIDALRIAVERANYAIEGVPEETRDPQPDGTTKYSRPLPGAARMYPETDVPPISITDERMEHIRKNMPEFPEEIEKRLVSSYGINAQQANQIVRQSRDELFVKISEGSGMTAAAATTLTNTYTELEHEGLDPDSMSDVKIMGLFDLLKAGRFSKEALPSLLREMIKGSDAEAAIGKLGLEAVDSGEASRVIAALVKEREDFVRSKGLDAIGPLMGPVMGALRGKIDGKQANDLLAKEIKKLIG